MPKLTNYTFVEIFDEERKAGDIELTEPVGMLDVGDAAAVFSKVTGLYCSDLRVLLIDHRAGRFTDDGEFYDLKQAPKPHVVALRNIGVTAAVRDLPSHADEWHQFITAWCDGFKEGK